MQTRYTHVSTCHIMANQYNYRLVTRTMCGKAVLDLSESVLGRSQTHSGSQVWKMKVSEACQSGLPAPPSHGRVCQAHHEGHWVQMSPAFEAQSRKHRHPTGQQFSSKFTPPHIWELPEALPPCHPSSASVSSPVKGLGTNAEFTRQRASMGWLCQAIWRQSKDGTSKDAGRPRNPLSEASNFHCW